MTQLTDREALAVIRETVAKAAGPMIARLDRIVAAAEAERLEVRKAEIDDMAREVIAAHDKLVEKEIAAGVRKTRPVRKAGMSVAEQLREIADEAAVAKRNRDAWRGWL